MYFLVFEVFISFLALICIFIKKKFIVLYEYYNSILKYIFLICIIKIKLNLYKLKNDIHIN